jgi:hypothetical protein
MDRRGDAWYRARGQRAKGVLEATAGGDTRGAEPA